MNNYSTSTSSDMYYYDTIKLGLRQEIDQKTLNDLWGGYKRDPFFDKLQERYWDSRSETAANGLILNYYPVDLHNEPNPLIGIEFSLPKMINDCNHQLLNGTNFHPAIKELGELINSDYPEIRKFSFHNCSLLRVDCTINFQVGERLSEYLNTIPFIPYPRRKAKAYPYSGVVFESSNQSLTFYDKEKQCKCPDAHGLLRMESSIRDSRFIRKLLGKDFPTIFDLTTDFAPKVLEEDLSRLGLNNAITVDRDEALDLLVDRYGKKGVDLYGFLAYRQGKSRKQICDELGISRQTLSSKERLIKKAGITLAIGKKKSLPSLRM